MTTEDRTNYPKLREAPKYCPQCDPGAQIVVTNADPMSQCTCGQILCVVTQHSGKVVDNGQYDGSVQRYSKPVALVTGHPTAWFPSFYVVGIGHEVQTPIPVMEEE